MQGTFDIFYKRPFGGALSAGAPKGGARQTGRWVRYAPCPINSGKKYKFCFARVPLILACERTRRRERRRRLETCRPSPSGNNVPSNVDRPRLVLLTKVPVIRRAASPLG